MPLQLSTLIHFNVSALLSSTDFNPSIVIRVLERSKNSSLWQKGSTKEANISSSILVFASNSLVKELLLLLLLIPVLTWNDDDVMLVFVRSSSWRGEVPSRSITECMDVIWLFPNNPNLLSLMLILMLANTAAIFFTK